MFVAGKEGLAEGIDETGIIPLVCLPVPGQLVSSVLHGFCTYFPTSITPDRAWTTLAIGSFFETVFLLIRISFVNK